MNGRAVQNNPNQPAPHDTASQDSVIGDSSEGKESSLSYLLGSKSDFMKNPQADDSQNADAIRVSPAEPPKSATPKPVDKVLINSPTITKPSTKFLYIILAMNLFIPFGQNFVFDFPQSLEEPLMTSLRVDTFKISMLYAVYSLPNLVFSPITGYVIEVIGCHNSAVIYTAIVFFGQAIIYAGVMYRNYTLVVVGRGIYGVGGEGLTILQLTINELWFYGNFLSVSVAWCDIVAVLGLLLGNYINPELLTMTRTLEMTFFVAALTCFGSALFGLGYYIYHRKYKSYLDEKEDLDESMIEDELDEINKTKAINDKTMKLLPLEDDAEDNPPSNTPQISFGFKSIKFFSATYWILCVVFLFLANCYYQFSNISTEILMNRYMYEFSETNKFTIVPEVAFIVVSPFLSVFIETKGKKPLWLVIASVGFLANYAWLFMIKPGKTNILYINFAINGLCYSIVTCALFSSVALSIPKAGVSMGYSVLTLVENFGLSALPLFFGKITKDRTVGSYNNCLLSLIILSALALLFSMLLLLYDIQGTRMLTLPENSKRVKQIRRVIDSDFVEKSLRSFSMSMLQSQQRDATGMFDDSVGVVTNPRSKLRTSSMAEQREKQ